jgi:hypothetical protein
MMFKKLVSASKKIHCIHTKKTKWMLLFRKLWANCKRVFFKQKQVIHIVTIIFKDSMNKQEFNIFIVNILDILL